MPTSTSLAQKQRRSERSDAAANRERILEAALEVLASRGLAAEMKEIAERAGVGVGTLYRNFESRDALVAAVVQLTMEDMLQRLRAAVKGVEPMVALGEMIRAAAEACDRFGALAEVVLSGQVGDSTGFTDLLAEVMRSGIEEGSFRSDLDVPLAIAVLESVVSSGAFLRLAAQRSSSAAANALEDFFFRGVAPDAKV